MFNVTCASEWMNKQSKPNQILLPMHRDGEKYLISTSTTHHINSLISHCKVRNKQPSVLSKVKVHIPSNTTN
jgi:hypothetical protein